MPPSSSPTPNLPHPTLLSRLILIRPGEALPILLSAAYFFFLLLSYYLLRPVRETMGIARSADDLPWLMTATLGGMLILNPLFAWLVSRTPRRVFVPATYAFFALNLGAFFALFRLLPGHGGLALGYCFYVWLSIFNLFVVSIFWSVMADRFDHEQSKRLFGIIAIGGTLGAIAGAWFTRFLTTKTPTLPFGIGSLIEWKPPAIALDAPWLMLIAIIPLLLAAACGLGVLVGSPARSAQAAEPGPKVMEGLTRVARSRYLQLICLYMFLFTTASTLLYVEQGHIVGKAFTDTAARTAAFAQIDQWTNTLTLVVQLLLAGRVVRLIGIRGALAVLPIVTLIGFGAILIWPTFAVLTVVLVVRRGLHYAIDRPSREALYTVLGPEEKFKSKPFIDTFVYRAGDMVGGWVPLLLGRVSTAITPALFGLPVCLVWLINGLLINPDRERDRRSASATAPDLSPPPTRA